MRKLLFAILLLLAPLCAWGQASLTDARPRVIITCDPELDDQNSLIRFLLYSTDYRVEGLIYASSQFHWKGDGRGTLGYVPGREYSSGTMNWAPMTSHRWAPDERFIDDVVEAYEQVYPNLRVHHASYPTPEWLKSRIRVGNVEFDGDISKDTPGSELIKTVLLDEEEGPVFINVWGGASTVARALKSIADIYGGDEHWEEIRQKVSRKAVLCLSGDQDDTYARYIGPFWPQIRKMEISSMAVGLAYMAQLMCKPGDRPYYSTEWMQANVSSQGPLGEMYRVWGDGKQMVEGDVFDYFGLSGYSDDELRAQGYFVWAPVQPKGSFLAEGDTYCFLNLIDNGLRAHEDPTYGGWCGGHIELPDSVSSLSARELSAYTARHYPLPDFVPAVMNGLAARLRWSVTPVYAEANHAPVIEGPLALHGQPGETLRLKFKVSDPDRGDAVTVAWWPYVQACTYPHAAGLNVADPAKAITTFTIPDDARPGQTIHLILEATDRGSPRLNHYHRLIITVD